VAELLALQGERVRVVTRRGAGPQNPAVERVAADATDVSRLVRLTEGADALYNCANPQYHRWITDWPPLASALLAAAEQTGALLATATNLYGYGEVAGPITEWTPLAASHPKLRVRVQMWADAQSAHDQRRICATEVRSSDYIEANSLFGVLMVRPLVAGRRSYVPASLDVPHSWTSIADAARTLVTVAADERAWGRAWLAPTDPPVTLRELATSFTMIAGAPPPKLSAVPYPALWAAGVFSPLLRELRITSYQWTRPFVVDSALTERTFGLAPTPLSATLAARADRESSGAPAGLGRRSLTGPGSQ
jgi:nucleoside-diphosphate-sugar epimerase